MTRQRRIVSNGRKRRPSETSLVRHRHVGIGGAGVGCRRSDATYSLRLVTPETALKAAQAGLKKSRDSGYRFVLADALTRRAWWSTRPRPVIQSLGDVPSGGVAEHATDRGEDIAYAA